VDTNIWEFGFVKPKEKEFSELHELARSFLSSILADETIRIAVSSYQIAEILEVLRKSGMDEEQRLRILHDFQKAKFYVRDLSFADTSRAVTDSARSNIHVYDYLVAYPLRGMVGRIYSADTHFAHEDFKSIAQVINPLAPWSSTEGKRPEKRRTIER
jgi:predicted nucleic acid-binding protein